MNVFNGHFEAKWLDSRLRNQVDIIAETSSVPGQYRPIGRINYYIANVLGSASSTAINLKIHAFLNES